MIKLRLRQRKRRPIPYMDPLRLGRHPFQTFILALCILSSLPLLFGHPTAGSIEKLLPEWMANLWGAALLFGSSLGLAGSYWRGQYADGLVVERVGCILTGAAAAVYAACIPLVAYTTVEIPSSQVLTATGIIVGFAAACLRRAYDIGTILIRAAATERRPVAREGESDAETQDRDEGKK